MLKNQIKNNAQLRRALMPVLQSLVNYILDEIYNLNQKKIEEIVYSVYNPTFYKRTGQFKDSWEVQKSNISGNYVKGEFGYNPNKMIYNQSKAQHGSFYNPPGDARAYLAEIIYEGLAINSYGNGPINDDSWANKRDAWNALIEALGEDTINKWVKKYFKTVDITLG